MGGLMEGQVLSPVETNRNCNSTASVTPKVTDPSTLALLRTQEFRGV